MQRLVAHSMTAIFVLCFMLGILIWLITASMKLALPQNPATVIGLAICLSSSCDIPEILNGMGNSERDTLQAMLDGCYYRSCWNQDDGIFEVLVDKRLWPNDDLEMCPQEQSSFEPISLKVPARLTFSAILLAIIVSLEVTLRLSDRDQGLGDVPADSKIIRYFWTALPGFIFTLIGMYFASVDFETRSLAPFLHLVGGSRFMSSVGADLVNKHTFLLLYEESKTKSFEALSSTLAVTLTSLLTIFSTGLFTSAVVTLNIPTKLAVAKPIWYNTRGASSEFGLPDYSLNSAALILDSNLSYPSFTYEDLILPTLEVDRTFRPTHPEGSAVEFTTTLLAARLSFAQCRILNSSQIDVNFTSWRDDEVGLYIESEDCRSDTSAWHEWWNLGIPLPVVEDSVPNNDVDIDQLLEYVPEYLPLAPEAYFAVAASIPGASREVCSERLWVWGRWSTSMVQEGDSPRVLSASALACNESMETVEVDVSLFGPDLSINPSRPPMPHQSAASSVGMQSWWENPIEALNAWAPLDLYSGLPELSTNMADRLFDNFFTLLTTSRYAIPLDMLGNQSQAPIVAEAIKFHHKVIVAQRTAASLERTPDTTKSMHDWGYEIVPGTNQTSYHATSSVRLDRPRVVQNGFSTRVLQGLLLGTLICSLVNWYLMSLAGGSGVIPRSPNTIGNVAALLADGNLIDRSRSINGQTLDLQGVRDHLGRDTVFRLGWCEIPGREEQVFCIYADDWSCKAGLAQHTDAFDGAGTQDDARL